MITEKAGSSTAEVPPRALLVGLTQNGDAAHTLVLLEELAELVDTLGVEIAESMEVHLREPHAKYLLGTGKAEELAEIVKAGEYNWLVFDDTLNPSQQRNLEELMPGVRVLDRQEIILEIFSSRAQSKAASLQVELAHLEYQLPRLKRAWTHLDRQRGGGATQRDAGEKQLQLDKRMLAKRIDNVKRELKNVVRQRAQQRKKRRRAEVPAAALVGYTNAGKSTLLNKLTGADVYAENKLFATLDPTTRRLPLPSGTTLLVTDTVGFVRKLPHRLVEAFKATLEEAMDADVLLHVADASNPHVTEHIETTLKVIGELGADAERILMVFNKIDCLPEAEAPLRLAALRTQYPGALFVSAHTGEGFEALLAHIDELCQIACPLVQLKLPHTRYDIIGQLHTLGAVDDQRVEDDAVYLTARVPDTLRKSIEKYIVHSG